MQLEGRSAHSDALVVDVVSPAGGATPAPPTFANVADYAAAFDAWLATTSVTVAGACVAEPVFERRVAAMRALIAELYDTGWSRYGWPKHLGGLGGTITFRAAMWEALARRGVHSMAVYEHLEVLAPTLAALGPPDLVAEWLPAFLSGAELWSQGFSEPDSGSDLASLRTIATADGDDYLISGAKIWTSWSKYADRCLVLARTGDAASRHRGLSAFVVKLDAPGVEVRVIDQVNGTDELAEVHFDSVRVPAAHIVGELNGGWTVAVHILSHERGTYAWFRHCFEYQQLLECARSTDGRHDSALGDSLLDLFATSAAGYEGIVSHAVGTTLGPRAAFNKLLLCAAEQSVQDRVLAAESDLAIGAGGAEADVRRQAYLFSRIVTVYGGSQQMQLDTIAKQALGLP